MEGKNPTFLRLKEIESFGYACCILTQALGNLKTNMLPAYKPCYEIESTYAECSLDKVIEFCCNPSSDFAEYNEYLARIGQQLIIQTDKSRMLLTLFTLSPSPLLSFFLSNKIALNPKSIAPT